MNLYRTIMQRVADTIAANKKMREVRTRINSPLIARGYSEIPLVEETQREGEPYLVIKDVVYGLDCDVPALPLALLVKECTKEEEEVYLCRRKDLVESSCKSIMDLMVLGPERGELMDLLVQRRYKDSGGLAIKIYSGITTLGERPDFHRLDKR